MKNNGRVARVSLAVLSTLLLSSLALPRSAGAATFTVTNQNDSGPGSLRQAILDANRFPDEDQIEFSIPGAGVRTIRPFSALPAIIYPVTIDGYTQPGAAPNTLEVGNNAVLLIELDGSFLDYYDHGLVISGSNITIRGLVVNDVGNFGIVFAGTRSEGNQVQGCFIGTNAAGTFSLPNGDGVFFAGGARENLLGGTTPEARNLIAGNILTGVGIADPGTDYNRVQGNYIGTNAAGTARIPNGRDAVILFNQARNNVIGGKLPGAGNVLSGNNRWGIGIGGTGTTGNVVQGNYIGTDASGTTPVPNASHGVIIADSDSTIGGVAQGEGNVIAFNGQDGVLVDAALRNPIRGNAIFSHPNGLGIRLLNGGNNNQSSPVLTSATSDGKSTAIEGTLTSARDTTFSVDFFVNGVCHPTGSGEGESFLGSAEVATDDAGRATFSVIFGFGLAPGLSITATATDPNNNTSQFSRCVEVISYP